MRGAVVLSLMCILAVTVTATDGRDFAGFYEVTNVAEIGDEVSLTLTLRIFNYSQADVEGAILTLAHSSEPRDFGEYLGVSVAENHHARLSGDFIITRQEYERWQVGEVPSVRIDYQQSGHSVRRMVELTAAPVGEE